MKKELQESNFLSAKTNLSGSNKIFYILLLFIFGALSVNAQVKGDFRSQTAANGNWNDTLSWEEYNGSSWVAASWLPGDSANVNVLIQDGATIHLKKTPVKAIIGLTIGQGASGILDFDSINGGITVNGPTVIMGGGQINISATGVRTLTDLTINSSATWSNTGNSNITISGNLTNNGTFTGGTGTYTLSGAAKTISGSVTFSTLSLTGTYTNSNVLTVTASLAGGGTLTQAANATLNITASISVTNLNCTSNVPNMVVYNGAVAQTAKATTYYDLHITNTAGTVSLGGLTTIVDTVTIDAGKTLNVSTGTLALTGALVNNGTLMANGTTSTLIFQGAVPQSLTGIITTNQVGNLTINNAAGVTINAPIQILRGITLTSGALSGSATFTLGSGTTNPFTYIRSNGTISATFVTDYGTGANNFTYSGTIAITIGTELPATVTSLTINDSVGVTLNASVSVTTLNLTKGILTSTPNLVTVTGTTVASVTGGSATAYINGALSRAFPASVAAGVIYTFPVGKSAYQLFELYNPVINTTGNLTVEAFDANSGGTAGFALASLNTNHYWKATPSTSNLLVSTQVRLTDAGIAGANAIGQSATVNGAYINTGGSIAGQTILSGPVTYTLGYFVMSTGGNFNAGTYPVGSSSALQKLTNVAAILSTITATGNLVFEMQADYDGTTGELLPVSFGKFAVSGGNWTATIRPASGVTIRTTSGDPGTGNGLIVLNGSDRIIFDGRAGGADSTIDWIFRNTRTASVVGPTFSFINGAKDNTLSFLQVEGENTTAASGTILFGASTAGIGNDSNTVSYCTIRDRSDVSGAPANAINSVGTAGAENNNISIIYNNIFNFTAVGVNAAVTANTGGGGNWTITGNSFYANSGPSTQQTTINLVLGLFPGNGNNIITGNYIGGSAPACSGAAWTNYGTGVFYGISLTVDTALASSVQSNYMQNIDLKTASFTGVAVISGSVNIGNIAGNMIGSASVANSIQSGGTSNTMGIYSSPATAAAVENIANNIIANIYSSGVSTSESITGIYADDGINKITNNTIFNLTADNGNTGTGASSSVMGIAMISATAGQTVTHNIIHSLSNTHVSAAVTVVGIIYSGAATGTNVISRNNIHNFSALTSSLTAQLTGISALAGVATYSNNMIGLGYDTAGISLIITPVIVGIDKASTSNMSFYYNSVYIGGTDIGIGAVNTFAYRSKATAATGDTLINNVFMNARSNAITGGKHYAISLIATTRVLSNDNVLYVTGTGGVLANAATTDYASLLLWEGSTAFDMNSVSADPAFLSPAGSGITTDLHINPAVPSAVESGAVQISIKDDIDSIGIRTGPYPLSGQLNGGGQKPDIGADEGDFKTLILGLESLPSVNSFQFTLSPDPTSDLLKVLTSKTENSSLTFSIYNMLGERVYNEQIQNGTPCKEIILNVSNLAKGIYLLQVADEHASRTERFVKE